jgi:STE24 endopeptidase
MNLYAIIVLATLLIGYVLDLVATVLNLGTFSQPLPKEFIGVYDESSYKKSQDYTKTRAKFGLITSTFDLAVLLLFWFLDGFGYADQLVRSWNLSPLVTGLVYVGMLAAAKALIDLPFSIYSTFVIEEKFGFNKTTAATYIKDLVKGILLAVVLGGLMLAGVMTVFGRLGSLAWLFCWIGVTLLTLLLQFLAPTVIMPLFNKFTPIADGELKSAILDYARRVKFPLGGIFVMDGSKRSSKSNAFFTGFGKTKRIALFDTLIARHTTNELLAVCAHEVGHYKKRHIITSMIVSIAHTGVMLYLFSLVLTSGDLYAAFGVQRPSIYAGLIFFGMLFAPVELLLSMAMNELSRKHEYEADRFSVETSGLAADMISALKKLSLDNLSHLTPHPFYVWLNYSHPTVLARISAIRSVSHRAES